MGNTMIVGESISLDNTLKYMNVNRRQGDLIEAGIQNRVTAAKSKKSPEDIFKWAVIFVIVMVGIGLCYYFISSGDGSSTQNVIDYNAMADAITKANSASSAQTKVTPAGTGIT